MPAPLGLRSLAAIPAAAFCSSLIPSAGVHARLLHQLPLHTSAAQVLTRSSSVTLASTNFSATHHDGVVGFAYDNGAGVTGVNESTANGTRLPTPLVRHYKSKGGGYARISPLYKMQQEMENVRRMATPPVSTTMKCIMSLMAQFFVAYTVLFLFQALNRLHIIDREREETSLGRVAETVFFVPMLCIIFMAARMQAVQFAKGETQKYELPQWWVKVAMVVCTNLVFLHTFVVFICSFFLEPVSSPQSRENSPQQPQSMFSSSPREPKSNVLAARSFMKVARNIVMLGIYLSFCAVVIGILIMQAPAALWAKNEPRMNSAVGCTIILTVLYFVVHLTSSVVESAGDTRQISRASEIIRGATATVAFSPMLCSLFLAVRFRTLQLDGELDVWVQWSFYICSCSVLVLTLLTLISPPVDASNPYSTQKVERKPAVELFRNGSLICMYCGLYVVLKGLVSASPTGVDHQGLVPGSPSEPVKPLPGTLMCILILANLYFAVYLALWIVSSLDAARTHLENPKDFLSVLKGYLGIRAKEAVSFCPMFCILFLGTLMRSLQLTSGRGAPQDWCQAVQYLSTWAIVLLTASRIDGVLPDRWQRLATVCTILQYVCLCVLYAAAIATVVALFIMTPETANGKGSFNKHGSTVVMM